MKIKTQILQPTTANLALAARAIRAGEVVAFCTETVYGLGANAFDSKAVAKIFEIKGRPADNPLIVHVGDIGQIKTIARSVPPLVARLADSRLIPGALTVVLPKLASVPKIVTAGLDTVAVRVPSSALTRQLLRLSGAVAAPSANISGRPSPTTAADVASDLDGKIGIIIDGGQCAIGLESTVLDLSASVPTILRQGAVSQAQLEAALQVHVSQASGSKKSPGTRHAHYAPKCPMVFSAYFEGMSDSINGFYDGFGGKAVILCLTPNAPRYGKRNRITLGKTYDDFARNIFKALRQAETKFDLIIAEGVPPDGIGAAIINRLIQASGGRII